MPYKFLNLTFLLTLISPAYGSETEGNDSFLRAAPHQIAVAAANPLDPLTIEQLSILKGIGYKSDLEWERNDIYRIWNVISLLKDFSPLNPIQSLINISLQIDAMSVYKRSLKDRYREKLPWTLLSYMHHALQHPQVPETVLMAVANQIYPEIVGLQSVLEKILLLESQKLETIVFRYDLPGKVEKKSRKDTLEQNLHLFGDHYSSAAELLAEDPILRFHLSIMNTEEKRKIDKILSNPLWTHERKFELAMKAAEEASSSSLKALKLAMEGRVQIEAQEKALEAEMRKISVASFPAFNNLMGALFELENNRIASEFINHVPIQSPASTIYQAITVLGEALNNIITNSQTLGLSFDEDVLKYKPTLKFLRNVFEHPENYEKEKLIKIETTEEGEKILATIAHELKNINSKLQARTHRLKNLLIQKTHDTLIKQSPIQLKQENIQVPKERSKLVTHPHWIQTDIPALQALRRYLYHPSYEFTNLEEELDVTQFQKKALNVCKKEYQKQKPKGKTTSLTDTLADIDNLEDFLKHLGDDRESRVRLLQNDLSHRLFLQSIVNRIFQNLNSATEDKSFSEELRDDIKTFAYCFNDLRERRNFNTHDLWRTDLIGTYNSAYRLVYDMREILQSLSSAPISRLNVSDTEITAGKELLILLKNLQWQKVDFLTEEVVETMVGEDNETYSEENIDEDDTFYSIDMGEAKEDEDESSSKKDLDRITLLSKIESLSQDAGPCINIQDKHNWTPLHHAINNNHIPIVRLLLQLGANPHKRNNKGETPIYYAIDANNIEIVKLLLEFGALPDARDRFGRTPYAYATSRESHQIATLLKSHTGIFRGTLADELHVASELLDAEHIKSLIEGGSCPNLLNAEGYLPLALALPQETANVDKQFLATKMLLEAGANPNKQQPVDLSYPLHLTAEYIEDPKTLELLLHHNAQVNVKNGLDITPLHLTCIVGNIKQTEMLLDAGADVHSIDNTVGTPLLNAANTPRDRTEIIRLLLIAGANPNDENQYGSVLHHIAERNCRVEAAKILLEYGADISKKGKGGLYQDKTPLEVAETREMITLLRSANKNDVFSSQLPSLYKFN